jgi:hypothetical protein
MLRFESSLGLMLLKRIKLGYLHPFGLVFCWNLVAWSVSSHSQLLAAQLQQARYEQGKVIYQAQCAECHGDDGQGVTDRYEDPLAGDRSLESLIRRIVRTMPEEDPDQCVGEEAAQVGYFLYHAFYSSQARAALGKAPRITPARLTAEQFDTSVADLLAFFTPHEGQPAGTDHLLLAASMAQTGLPGVYFQSKGMNKADDQKLERVDPRVDFQFGDQGPTEAIDGEQFAIIWEGGFFLQETGEVQFRVTTENGARLYVNHDPGGRRGKLRDDSSAAGQAALIDGWVSSGAMRTMEAKVRLLGGRYYPIRLEYFKYKEKSGSIRLEWKPPHGVWELMDEGVLRTHRPPRTFVLDTVFPADDRSFGYARGSDLSYDWYEAVIQSAAKVAAEVVERLPLLVGFKPGDNDRGDKIREFLPQLAQHAYRRPLDEEEEALLGKKLFEQSENPEAAIRRGVTLIITSPSFLYAPWTQQPVKPDGFTLASRLALVLWDSLPDQPLLKLAQSGALESKEALRLQVQRMLDHPLTRFKMWGHFTHWLEIEERDLTKDKQIFPDFSPDVVLALRRSLHRFIDQVVWAEASDYRELLLADYLLMNDALIDYYLDRGDEGLQVQVVEQDPQLKDWVRVRLGDGRRSGLLTHPFMLSALAYPDNSSPIHRGVFLTRQVVGRGMKPPPTAVAFDNDAFEAHVTMREKVTQLTRETACMGCHSVINSLGFTLEHFDAVGRWRSHERQVPIDPSSIYETDEGFSLPLGGPRDVAIHAVQDEQAHSAFVASLFHQFVKYDPAAFEPKALERFRLQFEQAQFNIQQLLTEITLLAAGVGIDESLQAP